MGGRIPARPQEMCLFQLPKCSLKIRGNIQNAITQRKYLCEESIQDLLREPDLRKDDSSYEPDDNADNSKSDHQNEASEVSNHLLEPQYDPETPDDEDLSINEKSSYHQCDQQEPNKRQRECSSIFGFTKYVTLVSMYQNQIRQFFFFLQCTTHKPFRKKRNHKLFLTVIAQKEILTHSIISECIYVQETYKSLAICIFINLLDVCGITAFVVWMSLHPSWNLGKQNNRRLFLVAIAESLIQPQIERRPRLIPLKIRKPNCNNWKRKHRRWVFRGIRWGLSGRLEDLDYADDICLLAHSFKDMKAKLQQLEKEAQKAGLQININKTKELA
ncbi:hypothetical protein ANN_04339 [Periplaneta americana]|uniref:Reverse transcriptase domain-containing protein n=1 Tax=Periplaneta americana TaxID=6978 RepID=A0ABQ8T914_PERAM|nr:hypothetical protein ANN_04339 [Periplaneta americana]